MKLILASTSKYRSILMSKMGLTFECIKPFTDEEMTKDLLLSENATPLQIAETLSNEKGQSVYKLISENNSENKNDLIVVSGDQLVNFNGKILGKPHSKEKAIEQLKLLSGHSHELITCTTIITKSKIFQNNNITKMKMKKLSDIEINSYIELDNPFDCAGSIKIEDHGICLFEKIDCEDFSAIQGLPLIWITNTLKGLGYELFKK